MEKKPKQRLSSKPVEGSLEGVDETNSRVTRKTQKTKSKKVSEAKPKKALKKTALKGSEKGEKVSSKVSVNKAKKTAKVPSQGLLDQLLGFTPSQEVLAWVFEEYHGKTIPYRDVDRMFLLNLYEEDRNYHIGTILSLFDLCGCTVHPDREADLPPVRVKESSARAGSSFVDEYIREISVFPTLNREQEQDLAKLMEASYIRYKNSIFQSPVTLDLLDDMIREIQQHPTGDNEFNLPKFKALVVAGSTNLTYPQLWKIFIREWDTISEISQNLKVLSKEKDLTKKDRLAILTYKSGVAFMLKDMNIKENIFHEIRERIPELRRQFPEFEEDLKKIQRCYDRYIESKNHMVNYNLKLVVSIAKKFFRSRVAPMDVIQFGNEGLIRAAEDYNYKLKFKFSTYAIWWIRQKIQDGIQEHEHMIRIPAYRLHLSRKYNAIKERISRSGERVSDEMMAEELDLSVEQVKKLQQDPSAFVVGPVGGDSGDGEEGSFLEQMEDPNSVKGDEVYDEDATQALQKHLKLYPVRERFVLVLRYGLKCPEIHPMVAAEGELEDQFRELGDDLTDEELDQTMESVPYIFEGLPTELKIPPEELKELKKTHHLGEERTRELLEFSDEELEEWRRNHKKGVTIKPRGSTVLALADGAQFDDYIKFKSRDRLILSKCWLEMKLRPSVVKKILNKEGLILEDVATIFSVTKERVRQLEAKILRNISYHLTLP